MEKSRYRLLLSVRMTIFEWKKSISHNRNGKSILSSGLCRHVADGLR